MKLALRRKHDATPVYVKVKTGEGKKAHLAAEPITARTEVLCKWEPSAGGWTREGADALGTCRLCEPPEKKTEAAA